jgi:hypothetical protein
MVREWERGREGEGRGERGGGMRGGGGKEGRERRENAVEFVFLF